MKTRKIESTKTDSTKRESAKTETKKTESRRKAAYDKELIITDHLVPVLVMLVGVVVLGFIPVLRAGSMDGITAGSEPYYHMRIANSIREAGSITEDPLIVSEHRLMWHPYHFLLAGTAEILGMQTASTLLPILLGLATIVLFYYTLLRLGIGMQVRSYATFILLLSPTYLQVFSVGEDTSLALFVLIAALYCFLMSAKRLFLSISLLLFFLLPLFGIVFALAGLLALVLTVLFSEKRGFGLYKMNIIVIGFVLIVTTIVTRVMLFRGQSLFDLYPLQASGIARAVAEFGIGPGIALFCLILALIGFSVTWKHKLLSFISLLSVILLFWLSLAYSAKFLILATMVLVVYAGAGLKQLIGMFWELKLLRNLTIVAVLCGILFSTLSFADLQRRVQPDTEHIASLQWMSENTRSGIVLSHYTEGFFVQTIANRTVFDDEKIRSFDESAQKKRFAEEVFASYSLVNTTSMLKEQGISHLYITPVLKKGLVWSKNNEGLLFLLRNNETFRNIYDENGYEIWEFLK